MPRKHKEFVAEVSLCHKISRDLHRMRFWIACLMQPNLLVPNENLPLTLRHVLRLSAIYDSEQADERGADLRHLTVIISDNDRSPSSGTRDKQI